MCAVLYVLLLVAALNSISVCKVLRRYSVFLLIFFNSSFAKLTIVLDPGLFYNFSGRRSPNRLFLTKYTSNIILVIPIKVPR